MKQICLTPPASQGLAIEVPKHKVFPISASCTAGIPSPTLTPATAISEITSQQLPVQQQAPIFIIYAGQQPPKTPINGKPLLQYGGHILNDAAILQAQQAGQAIQVVNGSGLPSQAQIVFPAVSSPTNGVIQPQKRELPSRHFPAMLNGQTVFQAPPPAPTLISINGTTAVLQQNGHPTAILPPRPPVSIAPSISPPHLPHKRHGIPKNAVPVSKNHRMVSETKVLPPPLVQVKEEVEDITVCTSSNPVTPVSTSTSATHISPKMAVLPFSLLPDSIRGPPPPTRPSLPYILVNEKQAGDSPRHIFVKPPSTPSSTNTVPPVNMPIYRFSTLNNVQPLQILTSVPSHDSCVTLPDFMKQDTTIAH